MPNSKRAAAYHEVGHFCRAILEHENAVSEATLHQDDHGWGGNTPVNKQVIPNEGISLCCIALAGFLAEAKGVAGNGNHSGKICYSDKLLASVQNIIEGPYHQTLEDAWVVQVPLEDGGTSPGTLSRPDINEIPPQQRSPVVLTQALQETIAFLNGKQVVLDLLSGYLESKGDIQNGPFKQWLIRKQ